VEDAFCATGKVLTVSFHKHCPGFFPGNSTDAARLQPQWNCVLILYLSAVCLCILACCITIGHIAQHFTVEHTANHFQYVAKYSTVTGIRLLLLLLLPAS